MFGQTGFIARAATTAKTVVFMLASACMYTTLYSQDAEGCDS